MKFAHLSDLHFSQFDWSLSHLFSKGFLSSMNAFLRRQWKESLLEEIPSLLKKEGVEGIFFSGDFTTSSSHAEYKKAQSFIDSFSSLKTYLIPGNHDVYTQMASLEKRFYSYFPNSVLEREGVEVQPLSSEWDLILIDSCVPTPPWSSQGHFSHGVEKRLLTALKKGAPQKIVMNHFPCLHKEDTPRRALLRAKALLEILQGYPSVKLYLYGHKHEFKVTERGPLFINSGSLSLGHPPSFTILALETNQVALTPYFYQNRGWEAQEMRSFSFNS